MNIFFSLYKKKPLFPALLSALLLLAVCLTVIGAAMLEGAHRQRAGIADEYVTIAVFPDHSRGGEGEIFSVALAHETALSSGFVQAVDRRCILGAEVKGSRALLSGYKSVLDYDADFDDPCYNMAVFAVKCVKCQLNAPPEPDDEGSGEEALVVSDPLGTFYTVEAEILDVISLAEGYPALYDDTALLARHEDTYGYHYAPATVPVPAILDIHGELFTPEGEIPFQEGHTYLIYGFYRDYPADTIRTFTEVIQGRMLDAGRSICFLDHTRRFVHTDRYGPPTISGGSDFIESINAFYDQALQVKRGYLEDGRPYYYPTEEMLPRWAEYSGSWEDFLAGDEGRVWREEIIPLCRVNQSSATVILSDNVRSMYVFNTGEAGLLRGRFFDEADYAGRPVCMVSAAYAQYNGYDVGDRLVLDFYDTGCWGSDAIPRGPCLTEDRLDITGEYEIVGIYSAPEFSLGAQLICADTILVPKKSVPGSEALETTSAGRLGTSLILKNGTKESFLAYMEEAGMGGAYLCLDQSFEAAEISLTALVQNGRRLLWIGVAALILSAALAHFLAVRRFAPSAKTMRMLGAASGTVGRQAFGALLAADAASALLGGGLAAVLFSAVIGKVFSHALAPNYIMLALCAAAVLSLLALLSLLCAVVLSRMPLLQNKQKGG